MKKLRRRLWGWMAWMVCWMVGPALAAAQTSATVSVEGVGEVQIQPDVAHLWLGVNQTAPTVKQAMALSERIMGRVLAALAREGAAEEDVRTARFTITPQRADRADDRSEEVTGYRVANGVEVVLRDLETVDRILSAAVEAGANQMGGIGFGVADPAAAMARARRQAVQDAREKAVELARLHGRALGPVLSIREGGTEGTPRLMGTRAMTGTIRPGEQVIRVRLEVVYQLK